MKRYPVATLVVLAAALAGCTRGAAAAPAQTVYVQAPAPTVTPNAVNVQGGTITVASSDNLCVADTNRLTSGSAKLSLVNSGSGFVTLSLRPSARSSAADDIYRLADVGPGASANMVVNLSRGTFALVCTTSGRTIGSHQQLSVS